MTSTQEVVKNYWDRDINTTDPTCGLLEYNMQRLLKLTPQPNGLIKHGHDVAGQLFLAKVNGLEEFSLSKPDTEEIVLIKNPDKVTDFYLGIRNGLYVSEAENLAFALRVSKKTGITALRPIFKEYQGSVTEKFLYLKKKISPENLFRWETI